MMLSERTQAGRFVAAHINLVSAKVTFRDAFPPFALVVVFIDASI